MCFHFSFPDCKSQRGRLATLLNEPSVLFKLKERMEAPPHTFSVSEAAMAAFACLRARILFRNLGLSSSGTSVPSLFEDVVPLELRLSAANRPYVCFCRLHKTSPLTSRRLNSSGFTSEPQDNCRPLTLKPVSLFSSVRNSDSVK